MPRPLKYFHHNSLHSIATSVEEDFIFPPNPLINELLLKSLAQAQALHPVGLSHLYATTTHLHFLLRVIDPQDAADFMERFKTESAHAINRLLGREKRTIWCRGYDSPLLPDLNAVVDEICYIYSNPSKDNLIETIERHPGINTWNQFKKCLSGRANSKQRYETRYLPRDAFEPLPQDKHLTERDYERLRRRLIHKRKKNYLEIDCNDWMQSLGIEDKQAQRELNQEIYQKLVDTEKGYAAEREKENKPVLGRRRLVETPVGAPYTPKREGKRMYVHSRDKALRKRIIAWIKNLIAQAKEVYARWKSGDMSVPYPLGLFPPTGVRLAEPIGW